MLNLRLHSAFFRAPPELLFSHLFLSPFMVTFAEDLASVRAFKKPGTFRICGDNPEIPSSWITAAFYSPWHEGPGSLKAERPLYVSSAARFTSAPPNESC